jgi:hypothetical protein
MGMPRSLRRRFTGRVEEDDSHVLEDDATLGASVVAGLEDVEGGGRWRREVDALALVGVMDPSEGDGRSTLER